MNPVAATSLLNRLSDMKLHETAAANALQDYFRDQSPENDSEDEKDVALSHLHRSW